MSHRLLCRWPCRSKNAAGSPTLLATISSNLLMLQVQVFLAGPEFRQLCVPAQTLLRHLPPWAHCGLLCACRRSSDRPRAASG